MAKVGRNALDYHVLRVPDLLKNPVSDENQVQTRLVELWQDRRAVVCFFRHFGCRFCKQMAAGLNECYESLQAHGVGLVAVGMGTIEQAQAFRSSTGFKGELYVDPHPYTPSTYKLFHLHSGKNIIMDPYGDGIRTEVVKAGEKAMKDGFTDSSREGWTGSTTQAGGAFVLGPGNACDYMHRSKFAGDHPDLNELLAAATGVEQNGKMKIYASTQAWLRKLNISQLAENLDASVVYESTVDILSHNYENALGIFVLVRHVISRINQPAQPAQPTNTTNKQTSSTNQLDKPAQPTNQPTSTTNKHNQPTQPTTINIHHPTNINQQPSTNKRTQLTSTTNHPQQQPKNKLAQTSTTNTTSTTNLPQQQPTNQPTNTLPCTRNIHTHGHTHGSIQTDSEYAVCTRLVFCCVSLVALVDGVVIGGVVVGCCYWQMMMMMLLVLLLTTSLLLLLLLFLLAAVVVVVLLSSSLLISSSLSSSLLLLLLLLVLFFRRCCCYSHS